MPGEIEQRNLAHNSTAGITLAPNTWQDLNELASSTGVPMPETSENPVCA